MRWAVCAFAIMLSGCQGLPIEQTSVESSLSIMPLWQRYQQCMTTADPVELTMLIKQFDRVMLVGAEPPSWMRIWGEHVTSQPLRTAVDPQALGIACTLRAAAIMAAMHRPDQAKALYQRVLTRYVHRDWTYYVEQAKEALAGLSGPVPAVFTVRATPTPTLR